MKINYGRMTEAGEQSLRDEVFRSIEKYRLSREEIIDRYINCLIAYRKDQMTIMHIVNDVNRNVHRYKRGEIPVDELYIQPSVIVEEE